MASRTAWTFPCAMSCHAWLLTSLSWKPVIISSHSSAEVGWLAARKQSAASARAVTVRIGRRVRSRSGRDAIWFFFLGLARLVRWTFVFFLGRDATSIGARGRTSGRARRSSCSRIPRCVRWVSRRCVVRRAMRVTRQTSATTRPSSLEIKIPQLIFPRL